LIGKKKGSEASVFDVKIKIIGETVIFENPTDETIKFYGGYFVADESLRRSSYLYLPDDADMPPNSTLTMFVCPGNPKYRIPDTFKGFYIARRSNGDEYETTPVFESNTAFILNRSTH
jgi:hypothetical protein